MTDPLPNAPACARNREPILAVLREAFADRSRVLEIGSGTGQHAIYFAQAMPWLTWQCSDRAENLAGIRGWLGDADLPNTPAPLGLDVTRDAWPLPAQHDAAFTANSLHIMGWPAVEALFCGLDKALADDASLVVYGPFRRAGQHTAPSNATFDEWLRDRDPDSGVRDLEAVDALAQGAGFKLAQDIPMPANNACLVWRRAPGL